jgi:methylthioribose-1-phosphate isomerase
VGAREGARRPVREEGGDMQKSSVGFKTIEWLKRSVRILDQTLLPDSLTYKEMNTPDEMAEAIRSLRVRGAPLIGISGAYGAVLSAYREGSSSFEELKAQIARDVDMLEKTRPTAVDLFWALQRMSGVLESVRDAEEARTKLLEEARAIHLEDMRRCEGIGQNGAVLLRDGFTVLTHCNAGALATGGIGTALAPIYVAINQKKRIEVFASETRPLLQGARLTAWELSQNGIPVTLVVDGARGQVLREKHVDCIVVGADRIAANGDAANKIGTYPLSVLAREHRVPFYVAAPLSSFDLTLESGDEIPIEERDPGEVLSFRDLKISPAGVTAFNPAFDVTPNENITCIITERGILRPPFDVSIADCFSTP